MRERDHVTGQYAYDGDFDRMCRCGHSLGAHVHGGFACLNGNAAIGPECDGTPCDCRKFRLAPAGRTALARTKETSDVTG